MSVNHFAAYGALPSEQRAAANGDDGNRQRLRALSQHTNQDGMSDMAAQAFQGGFRSTRFDPFSVPSNDAADSEQRQPAGRARAGTLPSSWNRFAAQAGTELDSSAAAGSSDSNDDHLHQSFWPSPLGASGSTRQRENSSRLFGSRLAMPASKTSFTGSVPGTPSAYDYPSDLSSATLPSIGTHLTSGTRQDATHRSSLAALRQATHVAFQDTDRSSSAFGSRSRTPSNLSYATPFDVNTTYTAAPSQAFAPMDGANRSRAASNASQKNSTAIGASAFGPSIFTPTWTDRGTTSTDHDSATSRRSSTLGSSSRPGSKASFVLDYAHHAGQPASNDSGSDALLDTAQDVHTLDYLGLEHDDIPTSISGRPTNSLHPQQNRIRASTLAAMPSGGAGKNANELLMGRAGRLGGIDEFRSGGWAGEADANQNAGPSAAEQMMSQRDAQGPSQSTFVGRNRAGTVAALGGPGGRQRLEQELLRMASAGNQSGMSNAEVSSLLRAHLESLGLGAHGGILEGFPHLELRTPPPLSTRHSPHTTQPSTPTLRPMRSKSSFEDPSQHFASMSLGRSQHGPGAQVGQHMNRDASQRSAASSSNHQAPSRSLWIGNLSSGTTGQELMHVFAAYGAIESLRLLPEKECGFVNFVEIADAIRAREDVLSRLGGRLENLGTGTGGRVRIGFGRIDGNTSGSSANVGHGGGPSNSYDTATSMSAQGSAHARGMDVHGDEGALSGDDQSTPPTRALWIGSIPSSATSATLLNVFHPFGPIESARVLSHKNCGFINFERVDDAVRARKMLNGRDVLGSEVGAMRIGFAKVPTRNLESLSGSGADGGKAADILSQVKGASHAAQRGQDQTTSDDLENYRSNLVVSLINEQQKRDQAAHGQEGIEHEASGPARPADELTAGTTAAPASTTRPTGTSASSSIVPASDKGGVPLPAHMAPQASVSDLQLLMRELSQGEPNAEQDIATVGIVRPSKTYYMTLPLVTEVSSGRRFETSRLREDRRSIESGRMTAMDCDRLAVEYMDSIVDLASDYIGNTLVQKFFEACSDDVKLEMLSRLAPHLAVVGCHKNGTWAAQKILDCASNAEQISLIAEHLRPYIPGLLLNEYGNYVVQCCLPWKQHNDFVFDAMIDRCWEIAQGRYGARSMRACLESAHTTHLQRKRVAITIILNSVPLATSSNGALLLSWLLDYSGLTQSYRLLAPRLAPHLTHLCTHKVASPTVLRLVTQTAEPSASHVILQALFEPSPQANGGDSSGAHSQVLEDIVVDQVHGSQFIAKVLVSPTLQQQQRERYCAQVKGLLLKHNLVGVPAYRRLCEDLGMMSPSFASHHAAMPAAHRVAVRPPYGAAAASYVSPELQSPPPYAGISTAPGVFAEQYPVARPYIAPLPSSSPTMSAYAKPGPAFPMAQVPPPPTSSMQFNPQGYATGLNLGTPYAAQPFAGLPQASAVRPNIQTQGSAVYPSPAMTYDQLHNR